MIITSISGTKIYQFSSLTRYPQIFHGFFARHGGFSSHPYKSLNVGLKVGDSIRNVTRNIEKISEIINTDRIISISQAHGCKIIIIDKNYLKTHKEKEPPVADAIISNEPGVALMIKVADCQSIFMFDPVKNVVANVHCGWRGNVNGIIARTVEVMRESFGSDPADIITGVSPSLGPCCGEFKDYKKLLPSSFEKYKIENNHFNFWEISRNQLMKSGIPGGNIEIGEICTVCNYKDFFSYRKEKITGRCAAVIMLKDTRNTY